MSGLGTPEAEFSTNYILPQCVIEPVTSCVAEQYTNYYTTSAALPSFQENLLFHSFFIFEQTSKGRFVPDTSVKINRNGRRYVNSTCCNSKVFTVCKIKYRKIK